MRKLHVQDNYIVSGVNFRSLANQAFPVVAGSLFLTIMSQVQLSLFMVPFTLQTLAVFLIAGFLGKSKGMQSVVLYLLWGTMGLPVFAGFKSGFMTLAGPTGGYLVGFVVATYFIGACIEKFGVRKFVSTALLMTVANFIIYLFGVSWLSKFVGFSGAVKVGLLPFLVGDMLKIFVATSIYSGLVSRFRSFK